MSSRDRQLDMDGFTEISGSRQRAMYGQLFRRKLPLPLHPRFRLAALLCRYGRAVRRLTRADGPFLIRFLLLQLRPKDAPL